MYQKKVKRYFVTCRSFRKSCGNEGLKKGDKTPKKIKKNQIRGRSFQEENYKFSETLRIKGKHFQKRIVTH